MLNYGKKSIKDENNSGQDIQTYYIINDTIGFVTKLFTTAFNPSV